jgi:hypothetical protein
MISCETAEAFISEMGTKCQTDQAYIMKVMAEFVEREPFFISYVGVMMMSLKCEDPLSAVMFMMSMYDNMQRRQGESDDLKGKVK